MTVTQVFRTNWRHFYLSQLHELSNLCHPGQEPLVDLQGLLAVALLHLEVFLYDTKDRTQLVVAPIRALFPRKKSHEERQLCDGKPNRLMIPSL